MLSSHKLQSFVGSILSCCVPSFATCILLVVVKWLRFVRKMWLVSTSLREPVSSGGGWLTLINMELTFVHVT